MRPPLGCRVLIRLASWIVPARVRATWLANRYAELFDWWYLVERGEPVRDGGVVLCQRAFADAVRDRIGDRDPLQRLRAAMIVPVAALACFVLLALLSQEFAVTRSLVSMARDMRDHPSSGYDWRGDRIFTYVAPLLMALCIGLTMLAIGCASLRGRGWRYWGFMGVKVMAITTLLPLIWIELGTSARSLIVIKSWRIAFALATAVVFLIAMGRAMLWCVADQRRRCRVCLRRLVLPVSMGSWASQFEPSSTEMLCEEGHGALSLSDAEQNVNDHWTCLDDSWKALFR